MLRLDRTRSLEQLLNLIKFATLESLIDGDQIEGPRRKEQFTKLLDSEGCFSIGSLAMLYLLALWFRRGALVAVK